MNSFKKFSGLLISGVMSVIAGWLVTLGVQMILIYQLNESPFLVSMLYLVALLPNLIISPLAGRLLDKLAEKRILLLFVSRIIDSFIRALAS